MSESSQTHTKNVRPVVVSIQNQKGGVGKSTVTINLACTARALGWRTMIIDTDPQSTCIGWHRRGGDIDVESSEPSDVPDRLEAEYRKRDFIFVDTAGSGAAAHSRINDCSDIVIVPFSTSVDDRQPSLDTHFRARRKTRAYLLPCLVDPRSSGRRINASKTTIQTLLQRLSPEFRAFFLTSIITRRLPLTDQMASGGSCQSGYRNNESRSEFDRLFEELTQKLCEGKNEC
ncbi:ParA family protein [Notoacmeibacter ruber]|nr:ParA family protein [Notoacmeibacter ruber]